MDVKQLQHFDFHRAAEGGEALTLSLTSDFFTALDQQELLGGEVSVTLRVRRRYGEQYEVQLSYAGSVSCPCDRCLEPVSLPVEGEETLTVAHADEAASDADILVTDVRGECGDLAWALYEVIVTSLPLERTHAEGDCEASMLSYISGYDDELSAAAPEDE